MRFVLGSLNPVKFNALCAVLEKHRGFGEDAIGTCEAASCVPEQPLSLQMTIAGATNRARTAFGTGSETIGVGIESGLIRLQGSLSGWGNIAACVMFDGSRCYTGTSSIFEVPQDIMRHVLSDYVDLSEATHRAEYTDKTRIGYAEGLIGVLTGGRIDRKTYLKPAIENALIHLVRAWEQPR